jgi:transposase
MDRPEAEKIYASGKEATVLALLQLAAENKLLRERVDRLNRSAGSSDSPSTPSGMIPPYEKPSASGRRRKQPGRKKGHPGSRRPAIAPEAITHTQEHPLHACPHCNGPVSLMAETRERFTEDIPEEKPELTRHIQQVGWCAPCKKKVVAIVSDALPGATIGNRALVLTSWLHYGLGTTVSHIVQVFGAHFHFPLTPGGLIQMWLRLSQILYPWYLQICEEARASAYLHADETGWRVNGVTHWLWCFCNHRLTCYLIHRCRGSPVLAGLFGELFSGILISDFWSAYDKLQSAARQVCFVHLFRELEKVAKVNQNPEWLAFQKKLARFLRDALRLDKNDALDDQDRTNRLLRLHQRLDDLLAAAYQDPHCKRLVARLTKHREHILTFLEADISADNNHGEREIRPAVIIRKNSYGNKSQQGAQVQAVLMSIYRTLKLRGHDPLETITAALKHYVKTRQLPPLPE